MQVLLVVDRLIMTLLRRMLMPPLPLLLPFRRLPLLLLPRERRHCYRCRHDVHVFTCSSVSGILPAFE